jgi:hypothetical protein
MKDEKLKLLHSQLVNMTLNKMGNIEDISIISKFEKACWMLINENPTCEISDLLQAANFCLLQIIRHPD